MERIKKILRALIGLGIISVIFLTMYGLVQQDERQSANDPQIQMAEDAAYSLASGGDMTTLAGEYNHIDIAQSLAPFLIVYDASGTPVIASGSVDGKVPVPPSGVFGYVKSLPAGSEDHITWQLPDGTRIATVIVAYETPSSAPGFVVAGRNLREIETRESHISLVVFVGWLVSIVGYIITLFL